MKWSKILISTLRESPADAEIDSHKLLVRAGLVRKVGAGLYAYLPLGMRTLRKIQQIVREEMDNAGAQEIVTPILQPSELWKTSHRWETMGANMFKLTDRAEHEFALGPTAEEVFTDIAKGLVDSYRQLPLTIYQMQWKFRDETRPRFGLMRSKEFLMKDAYSFDRDAEGADKSYWNMYKAYEKVFSRCGLKAVPVQADGGDMGDSLTHEFHVLADAGEDGIAWCEGCGYAANLERAERKALVAESSQASDALLEEVATPNARTIEEVASFLGLESNAFVKSLVYAVDGKPVMVCIPGDRDVNEVKLKRFLGAKNLALATPSEVEEATGAKAGFVGPVKPANETMRIVADISLKGATGRIVGANKDDYHLNGVNLARDTKIADYTDLTIVKSGDICPVCGKPMVIKRGIEVGQVFKLGTKYTEAFKAVYKTAELNEKTMIMGCYGIGVSRTLQAVIEQNHDKDGIIWPSSIAPYKVIVELLDPSQEEVAKVANYLETALEEAGIDTIVDDREERPGVKFKDADLIGFPVRVVVGAKGLTAGGVEIKRRDEEKSATRIVSPNKALEVIKSLL
ncbi:MAG: proline--tRNA ligase [Kiritimatiellae bacterium]|nr:proline--tRNA ligase [Kiritimatiellia bacterium]